MIIKQGRPVYIERLGELSLDEIFKVTTEERLVKYYIQSYETLLHVIYPACSKAAGKRIEQSCSILDLKGFSIRMMTKKVYHFIQLATKMGQDNYPEILANMFIINAPILFSGIWSVVKHWVDEKTRKKVHIIGSGYLKELENFIDIENIPDFLGGKADTNKFTFSSNPGPWNDYGKQRLFPQNENEMVGLRLVFPPVKELEEVVKKEEQKDKESSNLAALPTTEETKEPERIEKKSLVSRTCGWIIPK